MATSPNPLNDYLDRVSREFQSPGATEHSYRSYLKGLLEALAPGVDSRNEPKRVACVTRTRPAASGRRRARRMPWRCNLCQLGHQRVKQHMGGDGGTQRIKLDKSKGTDIEQSMD